MDRPDLLLWLAGAGLLAFLLLWLGQRARRRRELIVDLPTSKTQGVFIGLVELKGTAECAAPATSYLAEIPCVHYRYTVSEHWSRTVTETYTDSDGKSRTRTRTESGWRQVASGGKTLDFYLEDDTGAVRVRPQGAEIRGHRVFWETVGRRDPLYYAKGPPGAVADSTHRRRFSETAIAVRETLFVVGTAREREDIVAAEIAHCKGAPLSLVTVESEEEVIRRYGASAAGFTAAGIAAGGAGGYLVAHWPGALLGAAAAALLWTVKDIIRLYNQLFETRNRLRQGHSLIEVQLQRRADLIPNLAAAAETAAAHERGLLEALARLRAEASGTASGGGRGSGGAVPHGVAAEIRALAEAYPALGSSAVFLRLQKEITETEQRIALARTYFNDIATAYNNRLLTVPDGWMARLVGFRSQPLLDLEDFERAPPEVGFGSQGDAPPAASASLP